MIFKFIKLLAEEGIMSKKTWEPVKGLREKALKSCFLTSKKQNIEPTISGKHPQQIDKTRVSIIPFIN